MSEPSTKNEWMREALRLEENNAKLQIRAEAAEAEIARFIGAMTLLEDPPGVTNCLPFRKADAYDKILAILAADEEKDGG